MKPNVMILDDDPRIGRLLTRYLDRAGMDCAYCANQEQMKSALQHLSPDCALIDLSLPDGHGLSITGELRRNYPDLGIIILTASLDEADKIIGLEGGADDYVVKPCNERELLARIRSVLRRRQGQEKNKSRIETIGDLIVDLGMREVTKNNETITLTSHEFNLLELLVCERGTIKTRDQIIDHLSGRTAYPNDRSVDVLIGKIRKKIEDEPNKPRYIKTIRSVGYLFVNR
ncbi:MAG: response regulator transcription factor [Pseudomonadales bacterium]|nr:response regulator transcription factor [Pseudomonadales bacterium]MBO6700945.1 response regulator transcription factor [Pseudomonadales bacterium]MBO7005971.1 response regulator transcription factor [Pseudomonadales bacterium]